MRSVILADELTEVVVCITADYIVHPAADRRYVPAFVVGIIKRFAAVGSCRCDRVYERSFVIVSVLVVQVGIACFLISPRSRAVGTTAGCKPLLG